MNLEYSFVNILKVLRLLKVSKSYIFVICHMRSLSSLLCHILGSHKQINGYSEIHQSYLYSLDLVKLKLKVCSTVNSNLSGKFVLDKIVRNSLEISATVLNHDEVYTIFLIRRPDETLKSMISLSSLVDINWCTDLQKVFDYYNQRLKQIAVYATQLKKSALFLESERLLDDTNNVLISIQNYLKLTNKLHQSYSTFKYTGLPLYGDPSKYIMAGQIIRIRNDYGKIDIPEPMLTEAWEVYLDCQNVLKEHCVKF